MVEAFNDEELADILPDSWVISVNTSGHSIVSNPDFPAQIEAEKSESRWTVGLYVYDGDLEHMNLISNDYSRSFEPSNFDDVKRCV
ncbi:hypothetical protein [Halocalculus aciditolerans]|uniref:Uncharacterized protein n=1 Tax=Halocalculus aciditolerans TaxID=1383812 RepID=A0A830F5X7_9EURY|nr:hypothetical protein [Halocalculus aciditolerans]GGL57659.1 hypothetical protein GCM10009039_14820 [Halocalculus aciditolerans]